MKEAEVVLEKLPPERLTEYLVILEGAKRIGQLGNVNPPKNMAELPEWHKSGDVFFLLKATPSHSKNKTQVVVGAGGITINNKSGKAILSSQFIKPEHGGNGLYQKMVRLEEDYAVRHGARKITPDIRFSDRSQKTRLRRIGYRASFVPFRLIKGKLHIKVRQRVK